MRIKIILKFITKFLKFNKMTKMATLKEIVNSG